jgi:hypothetical protein
VRHVVVGVSNRPPKTLELKVLQLVPTGTLDGFAEIACLDASRHDRSSSADGSTSLGGPMLRHGLAVLCRCR